MQGAIVFTAAALDMLEIWQWGGKIPD